MKLGNKVYLAGKITKNGWRNDLVPDLRSHYDGDPNTLTLEIDDQTLTYTGPLFVGCDHGCSHGSGTHGRSGGCIQSSESMETTVAMSLAQIREADFLFAWLDGPEEACGHSTAYGTMVEIGYAKALGRVVVVGSSKPVVHRPNRPHFDTDPDIERRRDDWFAWAAADLRVIASSPQEALGHAVSQRAELDLVR